MPSGKPFLHFVIDSSLLKQVDDLRFAARFDSRADTIKWLLGRSLGMAGVERDAIERLQRLDNTLEGKAAREAQRLAETPEAQAAKRTETPSRLASSGDPVIRNYGGIESEVTKKRPLKKAASKKGAAKRRA